MRNLLITVSALLWFISLCIMFIMTNNSLTPLYGLESAFYISTLILSINIVCGSWFCIHQGRIFEHYNQKYEVGPDGHIKDFKNQDTKLTNRVNNE